MKRTGFLTTEDKQSLEIKKFIFHVILKEQDEPDYIEEVTLTEKQLDFFKDRLIDASKGFEFLFREENGTVKQLSTTILAGDDEQFKIASKQLAGHFKICHTTNANDGALIIALVSMGAKEFVFLLKTDNQIVYPYKIKDHKAYWEEVLQSFVESKEAIQKGAIVSMTGDYDWNVVAFDAKKAANKTIGDYYRTFLDVIDLKNSEVLTKAVIAEMRTWHQAKKEELGLGEDFSKVKHKTIEYLENTDEFKEEELITNILVALPVDNGNKEEIKTSIQSHLEQEGLSGLNFKPLLAAIDNRKKKNEVVSKEGVTISWTGEAKDRLVEIPDQKQDDGYYHIVIKTEEFNFKN